MCFVLLGSAMNKDQWDPEFLKAIPIMKTRSGMQVKGDLWVVRVCVCVCVCACAPACMHIYVPM